MASRNSLSSPAPTGDLSHHLSFYFLTPSIMPKLSPKSPFLYPRPTVWKRLRLHFRRRRRHQNLYRFASGQIAMF